MVWLIVVFIGAIVAVEAPGLARKGMWRELAAFSFLLVIGTTYSLAEALGITLPNPTHLTKAIFEPIYMIMHQILT
ncbi:MAG: hypothetical protein AB1815_12590 [Bacillota bacterium]